MRESVVWYAGLVLCVLSCSLRAAPEPDHLLARVGGRWYTCREVTGVSYPEGLKAVQRVVEKYGPASEALLARGLPVPWDLHPVRQPSRDYVECYHRMLGCCAAYFVLDKTMEKLVAEQEGVAKEVYDPDLLDRAVQAMCKASQKMAAAEAAVMLGEGRPTEERLADELAKHGLVLSPEELSRWCAAACEGASLVGLTSVCQRYESEGRPTPWARALFRLKVSGPLLQKVFESRKEELGEAVRLSYSSYDAVVAERVWRTDLESVERVAKRMVTADGAISEESLAQVREVLQAVRSPSVVVRRRLAVGLSPMAGAAEGTEMKPGILHFRESGGSDLSGRGTAVYLVPNTSRMMVQGLDGMAPVPGSRVFGAGREWILGGALRAMVADVEVAGSVELPPTSQLLRMCGDPVGFPPSLFGTDIPWPLHSRRVAPQSAVSQARWGAANRRGPMPGTSVASRGGADNRRGANRFRWDLCAVWLEGVEAREQFLDQQVPRLAWQFPKVANELALLEVWGRGKLKQKDELLRAVIRLSTMAPFAPEERERVSWIVNHALQSIMGERPRIEQGELYDLLLGPDGAERNFPGHLYLELIKGSSRLPSSQRRDAAAAMVAELRGDAARVQDRVAEGVEELRYEEALLYSQALDLDGVRRATAEYMALYGAEGAHAEQLHLAWLGVAAQRTHLPAAARQGAMAEAKKAYARWHELFGERQPRSEWGEKVERIHSKLNAAGAGDR